MTDSQKKATYGSARKGDKGGKVDEGDRVEWKSMAPGIRFTYLHFACFHGKWSPGKGDHPMGGDGLEDVRSGIPHVDE